MNTSFDELKLITDSIYSGIVPSRVEFHDQIVDILSRNGIKVRQNDGENPKVTVSHPSSQPESMVVGLRYKKKDGTKSEDLFLFEKDKKIEPYYRGKLEKIFPEYKNSHKLDR